MVWSNQPCTLATNWLLASCRMAMPWRTSLASSGLDASSTSDAARIFFSVPAGSATPFFASKSSRAFFVTASSVAAPSPAASPIRSVVNSSRWITSPSFPLASATSGCFSKVSAILLAASAGKLGSICFSKPVSPCSRFFPRLCIRLATNCVTMVTAMLNNSITVATPIKISSVFSMLPPSPMHQGAAC